MEFAGGFKMNGVCRRLKNEIQKRNTKKSTEPLVHV
jgi:hypothetical protein